MTERSCLLHILPEGREVRLKAGEILADALVRAGIPLSLYCHKRGVCGKCAVRVVEGMLPLPDAQEEKLLALRGLGPDYRLACRLAVLGDLAVDVPPGSRLERISVLETGVATPVVPEPQVRKFAVSLPGASLESPSAVTERLAAALGLPDLVLPLACLKRREAWEALSDGRLTAVLFGDREVLDLEVGDTSGQTFGLAVDIGTTTVVAEILDLADGRSVDRTSALNSQSAYGADVVSRISFAFQSPDNLARLRNAITRELDDLVGVMTARSGLPRDRIYEAVIAGNTAMTHFLAGVPVDTLALTPFNAVFAGSAPIQASELGLSLHPAARATIVPNIKSFVGGDITAGLAASDFAAKPGRELFIDLGTNGEIVLKNGRDIVATSTAAGPAFEGMSISCGMLAVPGAAHRARWEDGGFRLETIGGLAPQGLCGTGLLDVLALGVSRGLIERNGRISGPDKVLKLPGSLSLTQQDVRELQLALAAVKSGVRMMLREFELPPKRLDGVYVAGAFGASLDIGNCRTLGLLSEVPEEKIHFVGNTALAGARKLLLSAPQRAAAEALAGRISHVSLASRPEFQDEFVRSLEFAEAG